MNLTIYSAGPIDLGTDIPNWRAKLASTLQDMSITAVIFDPSTAYKQASWGQLDLTRSRYIEDVNTYALELSNAFVVCLPLAIASIGTPIELDLAHRLVKPIILITDIQRGTSAYLDNRIDPNHWIYVKFNDPESIKDSIDYIAKCLYNLAKPSSYDFVQPKPSGYADFD